jgi:hypothetical protein
VKLINFILPFIIALSFFNIYHLAFQLQLYISLFLYLFLKLFLWIFHQTSPSLSVHLQYFFMLILQHQWFFLQIQATNQVAHQQLKYTFLLGPNVEYHLTYWFNMGLHCHWLLHLPLLQLYHPDLHFLYLLIQQLIHYSILLHTLHY